MQRTVNEAGIGLMATLHTFRPKPSLNADGVPCIGYGHVRTVTPGMTVTESYARQLLREDMQTYAEFVERVVTVPLTDNQFSALTIFCAHVSGMVFEKTDLVRLLNRGWYDQVPAQLRKYGKKQTHIGRRRRQAEAELWQLPDQSENQTIAA